MTIAASAAGFTNGSGTTSVRDNDVHHFAISSIASSQIRGVPFSVTITAQDVNGVTIGSYAGTPGLAAAGDGGADALTPTTTTAFEADDGSMDGLPPTTTTAFSGGVWTGSVTVSTFDTNVVLTVSDGAGHTGASNAFNVATGPLHHFGWNTVASLQAKNAPFGVTVTAQDAGNNTVSSFNGAASLSGFAGNGTGSSIVITEINPNTPDEIEFMNVSTAAVDVSGWQVYLYDDVSWPAPLSVFTIPNGSSCAANGLFRLQEFGTAPGAFPQFFYGSNISWTSATTAHIAVLLRDASGNMVDFVAAGGATPASITSPATIPAAQWTGAQVAGPTNTTYGYSRIGSADGNASANWITATPGMGTINPGLITPFPASFAPVTITPTISGSFAGGVWSGNVTVLQGASQMKLRAADASAHIGDSPAFDVAGNPPTVTTIAATAVTGTGATLNGTVNANLSSTTVSFDYGISTSYGTNVAGTPLTVTGASSTAVTTALTGLTPGTTYHYRANGANSYGTTNGGDLTFTTLSNNANLSNLVPSIGTLSPVFSSSATSYTASVSNATASITVAPTVAGIAATVKVNGVTVASGSASGAISLIVGSNTITTIVTAQDGITAKTYSIVVTRLALSTNANLSSLGLSAGTLAPAFASSTTNYTASVSNAVTSMTVTPTVADSTATVKVNGVTVASGSASGVISLNVGSNNTITTVVTAQDSVTTKTYVVVVTRLSSIESWRQTYFGSATLNIGNSEDFDSDGIVNLLEFAFGTNPAVSSLGSLQYGGTFAGNGAITARGQPITAFESIATGIDFRALFVRRVDYVAAGLTYTVQFSADMLSWTASAAVPVVLANDGTYQIVSVPYPPFVNGRKARFFRVQVTIVP